MLTSGWSIKCRLGFPGIKGTCSLHSLEDEWFNRDAKMADSGPIFALISTYEMSMLFLSMHFVSSRLARKVHLLHCSLITFSDPLFHKYSKGLRSISIDQTTTSPEGANSSGVMFFAASANALITYLLLFCCKGWLMCSCWLWR
jgi:hypothetical protein